MTERISGWRVAAFLLGRLEMDLADGRTAGVEQGFNYAPASTITSGRDAYQADRPWSSTGRELIEDASETIDLFDLAGEDIGAGEGHTGLGQPLELSAIVGLLIHVHPDSDGKLLVGGDGTAAAWSSLFAGDDDAQLGPVGPDGVVFIVCPDEDALPVADETNHLLELTATGGDVTYSIHLLARSVPPAP